MGELDNKVVPVPSSTSQDPLAKVEFISKGTNNSYNERYKVYAKRWFMLYLLVMCTVCTSMQYVQYTIIADVVVDYYGVAYEAVDWSIMIFMVVYIPLNIVGIYLIQKIGIRLSVILSIAGACIGTWIKVGSVSPQRYWVVILGQAVVAVSQVFILPLPAQFASAWFGNDQVALASGIALSGVQLGVAIGFVIPPMLVKSSQDKNDIAHNMYIMNIGFAIMCTVFFMLSFIFFKSEPKTPPSRAQQQLEIVRNGHFTDSSKRLFKNYSYDILLFAYSINGGTYNTIPTLLNQIVLHYFPDGSEDAGRIGLVLLVTAIIGTTICGYFLDKFKKFKLITSVVFISYCIGMVLFTISLTHSLTMVYIASVVLGTFMSATSSVGLQVAAELTYPEPESISFGYLLASSEIMGIGLIYLYSFIFYTFGAIWANTTTCIQLAVTSLIIVIMPFKLQRNTTEINN